MMIIQNDFYPLLTFTGILLTFIVGAAGLLVGIHNSRNTIFVNSVTKSRIKHMINIRKMISEFCGLIYYYNKSFKQISNNSERNKMLYKIYKLKYKIFLSLNPEDKDWDHKIILLIEELTISVNKMQKRKIQKLLLLTQYMLAIEWNGIKLESKKGAISKIKTDKLKEDCRKNYNRAKQRL